MKVLKRLYYWLIAARYRRHKLDHKLDILLIYLNDVGISSVVICEHHRGFRVTFKDGTNVETSDNIRKEFMMGEVKRKKYWMSNGTINFSNGKRYSWRDHSPSWEVIYRFKKIHKKEKFKLKLSKIKLRIDGIKDKIEIKFDKIKFDRRRRKTRLVERDKFINENLPINVLRKSKLKKLK